MLPAFLSRQPYEFRDSLGIHKKGIHTQKPDVILFDILNI